MFMLHCPLRTTGIFSSPDQGNTTQTKQSHQAQVSESMLLASLPTLASIKVGMCKYVLD